MQLSLPDCLHRLCSNGELTDAFVRTCGGKPEGVQVTLVEIGADHWATGGVLHSER